jgi:HSF-type DNA-binding
MAFPIRFPFNNDPAFLQQNESLVDLVLDACPRRQAQERQIPSHNSASAFLPIWSVSLPYSSLGCFAREKLIAQALEDRLRKARASMAQNAIAQEVAKQRYLKAALVEHLQVLHFKATRNESLTSFHTPTEEDPSNRPTAISSSNSPKTFTKLQLLQHLGSVLRKRSDPLIDCVGIEMEEEVDAVPARSKGRSKGDSLIPPFPQHLHRTLLQIEKDGNSDVVSFYPHGRAFKVHDMGRFVAEILPKHFKLNKWTSFRRQLNLYGFLRVRTGPDATAYYHVLFLQSRPDLAQYMKRVAVSDGQADRRRVGLKYAEDSGEDPNFYSLPSACE